MSRRLRRTIGLIGAVLCVALICFSIAGFVMFENISYIIIGGAGIVMLCMNVWEFRRPEKQSRDAHE